MYPAVALSPDALPNCVYVTLFGKEPKVDVFDWLDTTVGKQGVDWEYEVYISPDRFIEEAMRFKNRNHQMLFELRWGEYVTPHG